MFKPIIRGIYAITPDITDSDLLFKSVESVLSCGIKILQYRNKAVDYKTSYNQAKIIQKLCKKYDHLFLINDHLQLASELNADGVHLGKEDFNLISGNLNNIREKFNLFDKIIGISCYNCLNLAEKAILQNANYIAFGAVFPSTTKPNAVKVEFNTLIKAKQQFKLPIVAIGGINFENVNQIISTQIHSFAMINALFEPLISNQTNELEKQQHLQKITLFQTKLI